MVAALQPELTLLLDYLIFRFSVGAGQPLPGMALMNLRHRSEWGQREPAAAAAAASNSSGPPAAPTLAGGLGGCSGVEGPWLGPAQRRLYCLGAVVLRYGWARLGTLAYRWADDAEEEAGAGGRSRRSRAGGWASALRRRGWGAMQVVESGYRLAALLNFLAFLRTGRYRCGGAARFLSWGAPPASV